MALKQEYPSREAIPAEWQNLYVERDGAWHLDVEPPPPAAASAPPPPVLKPPVPWERMTLREQMEAQAGERAVRAVESEVRRRARERGATAAQVEALTQEARVTFRAVQGRALPLGADGRTVLRGAQGATLSVAEWLEQRAAHAGLDAGTPADGYVPPRPARNPFRKATWNLTEQMRLRRLDPERAAQLEGEALDG